MFLQKINKKIKNKNNKLFYFVTKLLKYNLYRKVLFI